MDHPFSRMAIAGSVSVGAARRDRNAITGDRATASLS